MLSYQHIYHAGCRADVHKHAALAVILRELTRKEKALTYIETHAGRGVYKLNSAEALKTGEAQDGILTLLPQRKISQDHPFLQVLMQVRQQHGKHAYPGSPLLARTMLRQTDKMHLMELHPQEFAALEKLMLAPNTRVTQRDGFAAALAACPPNPNKGLVLIDPSYEIKTEYAQAPEHLKKIHAKWPEGVKLLWYPLLKANNHTALVEGMKAAGFENLWHQEVQFCDPETVRGMYGSGIFVVNLPEILKQSLEGFASVFR